ncbi:hypothetical protein D092_12770 [Rhodococcus ruber Chol-4]|uniref:DUF1707 domain-containing protein n=1 Tax=Rhodococcus ruber TaxID=1830 RepID=A0A098BU14_9NOCA|nr:MULTISPECIES: DUF1707 domain-containing protein [Rhodococcus]MDO2381353.1 DUF1707 domain-containing protein [Rhodococcus ruber]RIK09528.1 MAG: DUF1707 domain-containing protein [Acidobacteriota bacterium]ATQ29448.1 DUF1707 domain-containing protein [Rhodococcus ruber]AUM18464.1 DUF1707 domain-containing protein [Rhodococcus ruber]AWH00843.1 DUF1707 domain-containing protein [Rhodococcus ruber]
MESRDLRVSDAEREHVGTLLQRAVGQGMLSLGEFTERMDTALAAKTRGELNAVLVDLPGVQVRPEYLPHPAQPGPVPAPPVPGPGHSAPPVSGPVYPAPSPHMQVPTIRGRMSTLSRKGRWEVPPVLRLDTLMSSVTLDFTEAVMRTQVVRIQVDDYLSSLTLIVPAEATADINGLDTVAASAQSKVRNGPPFGPLHLIVDGTVRLGSVNVKHPLGTTLRKLLG